MTDAVSRSRHRRKENVRQDINKHKIQTVTQKIMYKDNLLKHFLGFFGPMWAHKGPYGPLWAHMGPARALEEREKCRKNIPFSHVTHFHQKSLFFDLQTAFFDGFNVLFRFLAEIRLRTIIKSPQKASSRPITCKFRTTCTLP